MADLKPISIADMESMSEAVLTIVSSYPGLPSAISTKKIYWQYLADDECIGIFTLQGGVYLKKYIDGSYVAQFPFRIIYKCNPTANYSRINKQNLVENIGKWLETSKVTLKDEHVDIQSIERTSPVYTSDVKDNGFTLYTQSLNIKYMYMKG